MILNYFSQMHSQRLDNRGFTLVELLVVISIIGVLSSITIASLTAAKSKANVAKAISDLKQIDTALLLYFDTNGSYPCFDHLWDDSRERSQMVGFISWPRNPWGGSYHWEHNVGSTYSISVQNVPLAEAQAFDRILDGNNGFSTGKIIYPTTESTRLEYSGMDQGIANLHCHI